MNNMPMPPAMPAPQDDSDMGADDVMVSKAALGPTAADLKVGDMVSMKVSAIQGDMISLEPANEDESEEDTDPSTMPLDKLEASLPKADRE